MDTATRKCIINHYKTWQHHGKVNALQLQVLPRQILDCPSESDVLEQSSFVEPYTKEPLASSSDEFEQTETDDEDGISSQTLVQRYEKEIPVESS